MHDSFFEDSFNFNTVNFDPINFFETAPQLWELGLLGFIFVLYLFHLIIMEITTEMPCQ
jgi:hypothetical protein